MWRSTRAGASRRPVNDHFALSKVTSEAGGRLFSLGHHRTQLLAGLEHRHQPRRHLHRVSGARIARHARLPAADLERPEAADLDVLLLGEGVLDRVKEAIYNAGTVFLADHRPGRPRDLRGHLLDKDGLGPQRLQTPLVDPA